MSSIHDLIAKLCPSGVCFKRLGDVARIKNGKDHKTLADGKYPVYGSGGIMRYANSYAYDKPSVLIPRKGSLDNLFFVDTPFWNVDTIFYTEIDEAQIYPKFFYYFLQTVGLGEMNQAGGVPSQTQSVLNEIKIPVPPIQIQAEIVRILDAMTSHTAELTAELTARKKQYNYYRDKLLSFEDGEVEWKELGEICRFINGRAYKQPELLDSGKYPVLRVGNFFTNGNWYYSDLELDPDKYCDKGDLLYAWSASFGPRIWEGEKVIYHYHIWKILPDLNLVSKKYLYYLLAWDTEALKAESGTGSTMMHIGKGSIEKRLVPVPSLKKQAQIVSLLDKFDALTASITEGLPREIELRQKQYEYYRDLLLNFPKPGVVEV